MSNAAANPNVSGASSSPAHLMGRHLFRRHSRRDIHNTSQIQSVRLRGKYLDRAALDQLLAAAKHRHGKSKLD